MLNNKKSIFDKINDYLVKRGHELIMSIYLSNYNGNNIYIRLDYVSDLNVYKILWFDMKYVNSKNISKYMNIQILTKYIADKIIDKITNVDYKNDYFVNDDIIGDRVEILTYIDEPREYVFDRFLPLEWDAFIEPLALIFSYLPRGMEVFLNEIFGKFDGVEESYNCIKPFKFNIFKSPLRKIFRSSSIDLGTKLYEDNKVSYLEKVDNRYIAIVEDIIPYLVIIEQMDKDYVLMLCNCKNRFFCKHLYAVLLAIRNNKFNNFYKVRFIGKDESLLEKVTLRNYYFSFGIRGNKLMLVTPDGVILPLDVIQNGKLLFEVIEDDDSCSLSKALEDFKLK